MRLIAHLTGVVGGLQPAAASAGLKPCGYVLIALLALPFPAQAQETDPPDGTKITSVQVSGLEFTRLSPGLQEEIGKLAGTPLNRQQLRDLAARIEAEQPRYITAVRVTPDPEGARVAFVAARIRDQDQPANINTKYTVEGAEIRGVPDRDITPDMRADLQALTGKPLDDDLAERLETTLRAAFPKYDVSRRTSRGDQPRHIKLVFLLSRNEASRWLRFEPLDANALFHSDQGWGANLPLSMRGGDVMVNPIFAFDNADDLVEEYTGFALRVESRRVGTERLGLFFEWSTYDEDWRDATLAALALNPAIPGPYRNRMSFTPLAKFAFTPQLSVAGGVGITELDPLIEDAGFESQMANAAIGSLRFRQQWEASNSASHHVGAAVPTRTVKAALESDLSYERYLAQAEYLFRRAKHQVFVSGLAGGVSGDAPLFERFSLGDSRTLRGWDKYDIAPAGGDRVFHASAEYRYRGLMVFLDSGSVWNTGTDKRVRFSAGGGFTPGPVFFTLGFPLNTDEFRAVFTMGFRFGISPFSVRKY